MNSANELATITGIVGSYQTQQLTLVLADAKPACRLKVRRRLLPLIQDALDGVGLAFTVGFEAAEGQRVPGRGGYSEWARRLPVLAGMDQDSYIYVGRHLRACSLLRRHDEAGNEVEVGLHLGYPSCCVQSFAGARGPRRDPLLRYPQAQYSLPWQANIALTCYGLTLLGHIPCSLECAHSTALAADYFDVLWQANPSYASSLAASLCAHVLYTEAYGVVGFRGRTIAPQQLVVDAVTAAMHDSLLGHILRPLTVVDWDTDTVYVGEELALPLAEARLFQYC